MDKHFLTPVDQAVVADMVDDIRKFLPYQGPIKDFIADNILYMFRDLGLTFHEALRKSSSLYGSLEYRPIAEYRQLYNEGQITDQAISWVISQEGGDAAALKQSMFSTAVPAELRRPGFRDQGYLYEIKQSSGIRLEEQVHPVLFRLVANFLDQGVAAISLAEYSHDFWQALRSQLSGSILAGVSGRSAALISEKLPDSIIAGLLAELLPDGADARVFLLEILMAARGWSGLISQVEKKPEYLNHPRHITLQQYLALYLVLLSDRLRDAGYKKPVVLSANLNVSFFRESAPAERQAEIVYRLWHDALEQTLYFQVLAALESNAKKTRGRSGRVGKARFQAVFCMDDREDSIRRHLEEVSNDIETFATPGFFGIDAVYRGPFDAISIKQCPVPVSPRHRIRGVLNGKRKLPFSRFEMNFWHRHGNHLFIGTIVSLVFGLLSLIRLGFSIHFPTRSFAMVSSFSSRDDATELKYERAEGEPPKEGYFEGYTVAEMAERVGRVLNQIDLRDHFGSLVAIVGHGSSSTNNPHFAAYDCGACSGRPGLVNARAFALMANRQDVRALLRARGIDIPDSTRFVGALHDTTRSEIAFLDEAGLGSEHAGYLKELDGIFATALRRDALERARRFAAITLPRTEKAAAKEVRGRSEMLFEPRPEYTHATNAIGIVAPRSLTENVFLDRRVFYNSYNPALDTEGKVLNEILSPFVPVGGGINLAYYFSRLDNAVYGAGSKLPHNIFSLIGVGNGVDGDLRTGLPEQMTEIHQPIRMMLLIEQKCDIVMKVFRENAAVHAWVEKGWVNCYVYDYEKARYFVYLKGALRELDLPRLQQARYTDSVAAFAGIRANIAPALIGGEA